MLEESLHDFESFIESLNLKWFKPYEFLIHTDKEHNYVPPRFVWHNISLTAIVADFLREDTQRPVVISSAFRAPIYNHLKKGKLFSQHQAFTALDVSVAGVAPVDVGKLLFDLQLSNHLFKVPQDIVRVPVRVRSGKIDFKPIPQTLRAGGDVLMPFVGGIGVYSNFTHFDTRGINISWSE